MSKLVNITGAKQIFAKWQVFNKGLEKKFEVGMKKGGLFLQRQSQKVVPVDLGNLRGGAFTRKAKGSGIGFAIDIVVGYVAAYAVYVHERLDLKHKKGKIAKYLEKPARKWARKIFSIVVREF